MQQDVSVLQLLQGCLECLDQMGRKLADKADRIREQNLLPLVQLQAPRRGVQRVEETVIGRNVRSGQTVEQGRFSRVGIADQCDHGEGILLAQTALSIPYAANVFQALFQIPDLPADMTAVRLQLGFTGAARPDGR